MLQKLSKKNIILIVDNELIKNKSLNFKSERIQGNSLNPDCKNTYKITSNLGIDMNKLHLFGLDSETNNSYCHKV